MSKRPSFQFYPADWRNNAKLRRCTEAARGVWMDILCILHDMDEYGVCRWPLDELARAAGARLQLVKELVDKGVLKGAHAGKECESYIYTPRSGRKDGNPVILIAAQAGPIWYCSRFVRDEYVRGNAGASTRFGSAHKEGKETKQDTERAKLRAKVLEKTGGNCYHCHSRLGASWEIDHYIPRSKGGRHTFDNMVPSCIPCNQDKSDTMPDDWTSLSRSPSRRDGDRQGDYKSDGSTSSSPSSSSKEIDRIEHVDRKDAHASRTDFQKIFETGILLFPKLATAHTAPIYQWINAGCDPDIDILPEINRHKGKDIGAWKFFTGGVMDARRTRLEPPPEGNMRTTYQVHKSYAQQAEENTNNALREVEKKYAVTS